MKTATTTLPSPLRPAVGVLGDTHGNSTWTLRALETFHDMGIDVVVQVGDFGWWPQGVSGIGPSHFMLSTSAFCEAHDMKLAFIDGNHEHHSYLQAEVIKHDGKHLKPVELLDSVWYLPRGCSWVWHDVTFGGFGGAVSIDKVHRISGLSWFAEEAPTWDEIDVARESIDGVDVLFTHDHPDFGYKLPGVRGLPASLEDECVETRRMLAALVRDWQPRLIVHGHWHHGYRKDYGDLCVVGLDRDQATNSAAYIDFSDWENITITSLEV